MRAMRSTVPHLLGAAVAVAVALLMVLPGSSLGPAATVAGSGPPPPPPVPSSPSVPLIHTLAVANSQYDWPELHQTPQLTGFAYNSALTTTNAKLLGVAWATNLYGPMLDSPVVAYDPLLGETLAYVGTEGGNVVAVNVATGAIVWGAWLGAPITASPLVSNGSLFVGTFRNPAIFKLNDTTGVTQCSAPSARPIEGTPTVATPPGGVWSVYFGSEDSNSNPGPLLAMNAHNCAIEWRFSSYLADAGSWDSASYVLNATGVPLLVFGTSDPDAGVYALNAVTGSLVWRFQGYNPPPGVYDIGAGAVISPPGKNGFAQGVAYIPTKWGLMYALALNNGTPLWTTNVYQLVGVANGSEGGRSTAALDGTNLIFGTPRGLMDLNAMTGRAVWNHTDAFATEVLSSPAIAGGHGTAIVAAGDLGGDLDVLSVVGGTPLYSYATGGYVTSSPGVSGENVVIASSDGFLYDFAPGGGNDQTLPTTTLTYPSPFSTLPNPSTALTVFGNATDAKGVAAVEVGIQEDGTGGPWWDGANGTWLPGPFANPAVLHSPGAHATSWSFAYPVPRGGATFVVTANAVSVSGQTDLKGNQTSFTVLYSTVGPHLQASPDYVGPGGQTTINGGGFQASETVSITLGNVTLSTLKASTAGALPATRVRIPITANFDQTVLVGTGQSSGKIATAAITVGNNWDQQGYGPGRPGYEPNDEALNFLIHPGGNIWARLAWDFAAGAAIDSSPALANGVAYVADTVGEVFAVDSRNGGLLWNWTLPSGAALNGSPAVDPQAGILFVGADDGTLNALSLANGTLVWNATLGGHVTAPIFSNGTVYVTSTSGLTAAYNESSGIRIWGHTFSAGLAAPASLNVTQSLLVVGELNGAVVELNAKTGAQIWSFSAGGSIRSAATVSGGTVYIGSTNDEVYALSQSTGAKRWNFTGGGGVEDTPVISSHYTKDGILELIVGADNGEIYALQASNGALEYTVSVSGPVVGLAATVGIVIIETSSGQVSAARTYTNLDVWHYHIHGGLTSPAAVVDGAIYVTGGNGDLYAFTTFGQPPD